MIIDVSAFNMTTVLLTLALYGAVFGYEFAKEVRRSVRTFRGLEDLSVEYSDCLKLSDKAALYIVRNF